MNKTKEQAEVVSDLKSLAACAGCRDNYYNLCGGKCWSFERAVIEDKIEIPVHMSPPYSFSAQKVLSCYKRSGSVFIYPESLNEEGVLAVSLVLDSVLRTARNYAQNRIAELFKGNRRAKIGVADFAEELCLSALFGELSALERITAVLVSDKEMTRAEIEAEVHLAIVDYYEFIRSKFGHKTKINLDRYLELRGYTGNGPMSEVATIVGEGI